MHYDTALRVYSTKRVEEIESADILVGIPSYNNEKTIAHVIQMVTHGLAKHYKDKRGIILVADGGSTDDSREVAKEFEIKPWQEKIVFPTLAWCEGLFELAATFRAWKANRYRLVDLVTPLYYARVASFVRQTQEMSSQEAEALVEEQAIKFEEKKEYLLDVWDRKGKALS